ncbi:MAG: hypothetical protein AAGK97_03335 [Bacteroidota bacterium]
MRYFSLKSRDEIEALEKEYTEDKITLKKIFAEEITKRVHGDRAYKAVELVTQKIFNKKLDQETLKAMPKEDLDLVKSQLPGKTLKKELLDKTVGIIPLCVEYGEIMSSNSEIRRKIKENAVAINKSKIKAIDFHIDKSHLLEDEYLLIEIGKKDKYLLRFE